MTTRQRLNTLEYDSELCIGCAMCTIVCPHGVFKMESNKSVITRYEACMECGACQLNCPVEAIKVESGVGCAGAMIRAALTGKRNRVTCGCG